MILSTKFAVSLASCAGTAWAGLFFGIALRPQEVPAMTLVERYGLLGLLALVIICGGGGILKIGWEQVKTHRDLVVAFTAAMERQQTERKTDFEAREKAVATAKEALDHARESVLSAVESARDELLREVQTVRDDIARRKNL